MPTVELNADLPATSKVSPTLTASSVVDPSTSKAPTMFTSLENTALPLTVNLFQQRMFDHQRSNVDQYLY